MSPYKAGEWPEGKARGEVGREVSNLRGLSDRPKSNIAAIVIGDVHLQKKPPKARSAEPDWFEAMKRPLMQIHKLLEKSPDAEVFYVGDIVNHWDSSAELINFALEYLPKGYSIAGQHDLPNHNLKDIKRSAYWTLVKANHLEHLPSGIAIPITGKLCLTGFSWKEKFVPPDPNRDLMLRIALVHKYIWTNTHTGYLHAPEKGLWSNVRKKLKGYDLCFFGDNHIPFSKVGSPNVINCGSIMNRNTDQRSDPCFVWTVYGDGRFGCISLDTSEDKWLSVDELKKQLPSTIDLRGLTERLSKLGNKPTNFIDLLQKIIRSKKVGKSVRNVIRELIKELPE